MGGLVAVLLAGGVLAVLTAWIWRAARELSREQNDLNLADRQLALYSLLHAKARDGPEARRTLEQVELSRTIYQNAAAEYNRCIARPKNRLLAQILGYAPAPEQKDTNQDPTERRGSA